MGQGESIPGKKETPGAKVLRHESFVPLRNWSEATEGSMMDVTASGM